MIPLPHSRAANLAIWVAMWVALFGWQAATVLSGRLPSIADVVRALRRWWLTRWVLLVGGWGWLGWHIFVRTSF